MLLESALAGLPDGYRSVFLLREVDGLSTAETARHLRISDATVKTRLHRAKGLLQRKLHAVTPAGVQLRRIPLRQTRRRSHASTCGSTASPATLTGQPRPARGSCFDGHCLRGAASIDVAFLSLHLNVFAGRPRFTGGRPKSSIPHAT